MITQATKHENIWIASMRKQFRIRAIASSVDEANEFCATHSDTGVIAELGNLVFIANLYEGISPTGKQP